MRRLGKQVTTPTTTTETTQPTWTTGSRSQEFSAGHGDARPDLTGYSPSKEQWTEEALRTVEDERERRLRE